MTVSGAPVTRRGVVPARQRRANRRVPLRSFPLGQPIPGSVHSVSCSLPTLADVIGYEERDPAVLAALQSGYPRFAAHPFVRAVTERLTRAHAAPGEQIWPVLSPRAAAALVQHLDAGRIVEDDGVTAVLHAAEPALAARAKAWLQHTGTLLGSRAAEEALVRAGERTHLAAEEIFPGDAAAEVQRVLAPLFPGAQGGVLLAPSGMSAMHAMFRAISAEQAAHGRTAWVQLGWLYLDTIALLKKFTPDPARDHLVLLDVSDRAALENLFATHGARIAGVVVEMPTNPLLHAADLGAVAELAWRHGARVVCDPSVASPFNVDVLPHADAVAWSLTKYTSPAGDVMAGAAVINATRPGPAELRAAVEAELDAPGARELARLASRIGGAADVVRRINASTPVVVDFLARHPAVERVWWAEQPATRAAYARVKRPGGGAGAVVSFTLRGELARFYDRVALPKGPSFGMATTLLSPYTYLAHYDLLPRPGGSDGAELRRAGLSPDLLRLSVGTEPAEEIIAALAAALA